MTLRDAVAALYRQVSAPDWAAPNLDALSDILRDLSWLPTGPVTLEMPDGLDGDDRARLVAVLSAVERETAGRERPVRLQAPPRG